MKELSRNLSTKRYLSSFNLWKKLLCISLLALRSLDKIGLRVLYYTPSSSPNFFRTDNFLIVTGGVYQFIVHCLIDYDDLGLYKTCPVVSMSCV